MKAVPAAADAEFCPYRLPCLAGANSYEWFGEDPVADADVCTIQRAVDICLLHLETDPFFVGLVDDVARLTHGLDRHESCSAFFFDHELKFLGFRTIAGGSHTRIYVQPAVLSRHVVELNASGVILVHSHPRGPAEPSAADQNWIRSVSEYLPFVGARLLDSLVVSGNCLTSMLELGEPAEAWPEVALHEAKDEGPDPDREPELSGAERVAINVAKAIIDQHQHKMPPIADLDGLVRMWMSTRISPAIGVVALDMCNRPMRCEIISESDFNSSAIVSILTFAVRTQAATLALVIRRDRALITRAELTRLAGCLASNLRHFDIELMAVYRSGAIFDQIELDDGETKTKDLALIAASDGSPRASR